MAQEDEMIAAARQRDETAAKALGDYTPTGQALALAATREQQWHEALKIVRGVAALELPSTSDKATWTCPFCGAYLIARGHDESCLVGQALGLLASLRDTGR